MAIFSTIKLSELEGTKRIDAEYYKPEFLDNKRLLSKRSPVTLGKVSKYITNGHTPRYADLNIGDVYFLTAEDILDFIINFQTAKRITKEDNHRFLSRTILKVNDLLITIKGKTGNAAVVYKLPQETNINQDVARIVLKESFNGKKLNTYFIATYINSKYGRLQSEQLSTNQINPFLGLGNLKQIEIPILTEEFQNQISNIIKESLDVFYQSIILYSQAENLLLEELRLKDFKPSYRKTYVANLSNILSSNRVDAEYFHPAYDEVIEKLKEKNIELKPLRKFILNIQKGEEPGSENYQDEGIPFIRVSNLSVEGFTSRDQKYLSKELYWQLRKAYEPKPGDFLLTKDATPGIAYVVKEKIEGIISSGILKLQIDENKINKEYLALFINSKIGKMQIEKDGGGSVIIHWRPEQVKMLQVPMLSNEIQRKIASLVKESHEARNKAKNLLDLAKKAIEIAIEKNEDEAMHFLYNTSK